MIKKIIVGMSGGVDSSVAALLLLEQGHHVSAVFMKNWEEDDGTEQCTALEDLAYAQEVCNQLDIPLHSINFSTEYWDLVFEVFLSEFQAGRTPNPDILCNKYVKFKAFLDYSINDLDADFIATGHYAQITERGGTYYLLKGHDIHKDQSYFLYTLTQHQLSRTLFPIGHLTKTDVRSIAKKAGFKNHSKKDSTGICFIGERKFAEFLKRFLPANPGEIRTDDGKVIGKHLGLMYYTLGQRQGLGIGGIKNTLNEPWYVVDKDLTNNVLIVGQGHFHQKLLHNTLEASQIDWCNEKDISLPVYCSAKTRYRQPDQPSLIEAIANNRLRVHFTYPQRAITPGQSVVFYQGEYCLGGGIIDVMYNAFS